MRPNSSGEQKSSAEHAIKDIRRRTRRHFSAEDKIQIVLEGMRGEDSISELCRREAIAQNLYYTWAKEFMEGRFETSWNVGMVPRGGIEPPTP